MFVYFCKRNEDTVLLTTIQKQFAHVVVVTLPLTLTTPMQQPLIVAKQMAAFDFTVTLCDPK